MICANQGAESHTRPIKLNKQMFPNRNLARTHKMKRNRNVNCKCSIQSGIITVGTRKRAFETAILATNNTLHGNLCTPFPHIGAETDEYVCLCANIMIMFIALECPAETERSFNRHTRSLFAQINRTSDEIFRYAHINLIAKISIRFKESLSLSLSLFLSPSLASALVRVLTSKIIKLST